MTFEEWWEEPRVGLSREEELDRALNIDYFRVNRIIEEAYEAGRLQGYGEGLDDGWEDVAREKDYDV